MSQQDPQESTEATAQATGTNGASGGAAAGAAPQSGGWLANLRNRALSGIPALAIVLAVIALAPSFVLSLVVTAAGAVGIAEYQRLLPEPLRQRVRLELLVGAAVLIGLGGLALGYLGMGLGLFVTVAAVTAAVWVREPHPSQDGLSAAGAAAFGLVLIPWLLTHAALIHGLPGGAGMLAMLVVVLSLNDIFAYLIGSLLGSRPLMPTVSPDKTVEGAIAGLVGGVAGGFLTWVWLLSFPNGPGFSEALGLGAGLAVVGQMGDLVESKLKRLVDVRESGTFLPGHGGLLDRLDSYFFAAPALYYYIVLTDSYF